MLFLGFEGLVAAFLTNLAAAKVTSDLSGYEPNDGGDGQQWSPQPAQPYYAAQQYQAGGVPYQANRQEFAAEDAAVRLRKAPNGHFYARIMINGQTDWAMVDTGASGVSLTRTFAKRVGVDLGRLRYDLPIRTGNGVIRGAKVVIPVLNVEGLTAHDVFGAIDEKPNPSDQNLIGNSFLSRLSEVSIRGNEMVLRP